MMTQLEGGHDKVMETDHSTQSDTDRSKTTGDYYFDSYAHHGIHEEMLKDDVRTLVYRNAILNNAAEFEGKVVLDVGCGTGILSLFAAKAGAKHVYACECSSIIEQAEEIIRANGFDKVITLIRGKVEEITLPVKQVDIIISEWMGYCLLYESMLNTVIIARDRWLAPNGKMLPNKATLYMAAIEDAEYKKDKIGYWDNVYGFDFSAIKRLAMLEPLVDVVDPDQVVSGECPILEIDVATIKAADLTFEADFLLTVDRKEKVHALIAWFDCDFSAMKNRVTLPTGPFRRETHWKQTVFYLNKVLKGDPGAVISGALRCAPNAGNPRDLDIRMDIRFRSEQTGEEEVFQQDWRLR